MSKRAAGVDVEANGAKIQKTEAAANGLAQQVGVPSWLPTVLCCRHPVPAISSTLLLVVRHATPWRCSGACNSVLNPSV